MVNITKSNIWLLTVPPKMRKVYTDIPTNWVASLINFIIISRTFTPIDPALNTLKIFFVLNVFVYI